MRNLTSLAIEQKEKTTHGEHMFPLEKYISTLNDDYPVMTAHWHEEAELTLITEGCCTYQVNLQTHSIESGDLLFISPLMLHSIANIPGIQMTSETYVFHLNFLGGNSADLCSAKYLTPIMNQTLILPSVIKKDHPAYPQLLHIFREISDCYSGDRPGYELLLKSLFLQVIFTLLPFCQEPSTSTLGHTLHSQKLKTVLDYIEIHYAEELTIPQLAHLCYFSEYHFMRFFKKYVGMTCLEYIKNFRLEKAVELFEQGDTSTLEVSLSVGFHNLSYFHREFKKKYGVTPKTFLSRLL